MHDHLLFCLLSRPGTLLDIGAHVGQSTRALLQAKNSQVVSFEPVHETFVLLYCNMLNLGGGRIPDNLTVHHVALGEQAGLARISIPSFDGNKNNQWASLAKNYETYLSNNKDSVEVTEIGQDAIVLPLDFFVLKDTTFWKVDVEGFEMEVLRGGARTLEAFKPVLFIELEERHRPGITTAVSAFLFAMDYSGFFISEKNELLPFNEFSVEKYQADPILPGSTRDRHGMPYVNNFIFVHRDDVWASEQLNGIKSILQMENS